MKNVIITGAANGVDKAVAQILKSENLILLDILGGNLVLPEYRGNGITTKLQTIELQLAKELGFDYIISMAHPNNIGSCKTLEKVGLEFVKETTLSNGFLRKLYMLKLKQIRSIYGRNFRYLYA